MEVLDIVLVIPKSKLAASELVLQRKPFAFDTSKSIASECFFYEELLRSMFFIEHLKFVLFFLMSNVC